jgi:hypothetical protein
VAPSKGWAAAGGPAGVGASAAGGAVTAADQGGPDWTFFTPWAGTVEVATAANDSGDNSSSRSPASAASAVAPPAWSEGQLSSGVDLAALTDTSVPILFFDEVALFEDELHDFG